MFFLVQVASMAAARDHLSEILGALNQEEFQLFTWSLQFTLFQRGLQPFPSSSRLSLKKEKLPDELLVRCGRQAGEVPAEALTGISMSDLAHRLSDGCPRGKGKQEVIWPELNDKVDQLESVIQKLMDKLAQLSLRELEVVKKKAMFEMRLNQQCLYPQSLPFWFPAVIRDPFVLMVILVLAYGQQSEDKISDFLTPPRHSPLRPGKSSSETEVDEKRSALIRRVATLSALRQLLVEILTELSDDELNEFTASLQVKVWWSIPQLSLWNRSDRSAIVDLMMEELGPRSVDVTKQLLTELKRTDLLQRFPASPQHKENLSVEKPADASVSLT
ncbi:uncharacterized protein LOC119798299 [Cyprinodon tularosa]|uniref:uncharacterized protein LOC119798299 n=1 Tax=Cyprinodon tularosa TaxID=77115 RepID=UPI0018E1E933|nr:uncharacterized protein LOC119798299 [Cyprinodon tularosa]